MIVRWLEPLRHRELVVGVQGRCVTARASHPQENLLALRGSFVTPVRVRRRLKRIDVLRQREQHLVWPSNVYRTLGVAQHAMAAEIHGVAVFHQGGIAHQIPWAAVLMSGGVIYVLTIADAD